MKIIIVAVLSIFFLCDLCVSLNRAVSRKRGKVIYILDSVLDFASILAVVQIAEYFGRVA